MNTNPTQAMPGQVPLQWVGQNVMPYMGIFPFENPAAGTVRSALPLVNDDAASRAIDERANTYDVFAHVGDSYGTTRQRMLAYIHSQEETWRRHRVFRDVANERLVLLASRTGRKFGAFIELYKAIGEVKRFDGIREETRKAIDEAHYRLARRAVRYEPLLHRLHRWAELDNNVSGCEIFDHFESHARVNEDAYKVLNALDGAGSHAARCALKRVVRAKRAEIDKESTSGTSLDVDLLNVTALLNKMISSPAQWCSDMTDIESAYENDDDVLKLISNFKNTSLVELGLSSLARESRVNWDALYFLVEFAEYSNIAAKLLHAFTTDELLSLAYSDYRAIWYMHTMYFKHGVDAAGEAMRKVDVETICEACDDMDERDDTLSCLTWAGNEEAREELEDIIEARLHLRKLFELDRR